jgi:hypothetical protein
MHGRAEMCAVARFCRNQSAEPFAFGGRLDGFPSARELPVNPADELRAKARHYRAIARNFDQPTALTIEKLADQLEQEAERMLARERTGEKTTSS